MLFTKNEEAGSIRLWIARWALSRIGVSDMSSIKQREINKDPDISGVINAIAEISQIFTNHARKAEESNDYIVSSILGIIYSGFCPATLDFLQAYPFPLFTKVQKKKLEKMVMALKNTGVKLREGYENFKECK